ncbi:MAG: MarR family transcriptional regulator [Sphingobacteriales bacterium JAD_PAG50586_3]|nr:MAG: MarR family transcriptional regulator [Sphingobacteriales bacterium JAD_PAG50586_3]
MSLEKQIKNKPFNNEQLKANINVLFTANWLYNKMSAILKPYNLTHEQFNILRILRGSHPKSMCQKDVLSRMIAPQSNITALMKKLVAKGLVVIVKSTTDKREYVINISEQGLELLKKMDGELKPDMIKVNNLSVSEAFHLNSLLDKIRNE